MTDRSDMRRCLAFVGFVACTPAVAPQAVEIPALPKTLVNVPAASAFSSRCHIDGSGEVEGQQDAPDLAVRETPNGSPIFVVNARDKVRVAWSNLPPPSSEPGRWAEVDLGGQAHLRARGYADLFGRIFQIEGDAPIVDDHVWVRGGSRVELLGEDAHGVHVGVTAFAVSGRLMRGVTICSNMAYQPELLEPKDLEGGDAVDMTGKTLHLRASPSGPALLELRENDEEAISLVRLGESPGYAHVAGVTGRIGFDGWVAAAEVDVAADRGLRGFGTRGYGSSGGGARNLRTVRADAPLRVGVAGHSRATHAVLEKGARVYLGPHDPPEERGLASVEFEDGWIVAPGSESFWIPEGALE